MMIKKLYRFLLGTLRGRLIISVAAVHAVMMTLFIGDLTVRQRAMLLDRQKEEAAGLSQAVATSAAGWLTADDISGLQELVDAQRRYPELLYAILSDQEGRVLADTDRSKLGLYMLDLPRESRLTVLSGTPSLVDVAAPAMIRGRHVGWARVGIGQKAAGEKLAEITREGAVYALEAILIGSVIAWFVGRRISRRLYAVQKTIDAVRSGNLLARSTIAGFDEAAVMAREFNSMLDALAERDVELHASEERYRSLIRKVQTAIVLYDSQGRILISNPLAQELLGFSADQLLGKALIDQQWHFLQEDGSVMPVAEYPVNLVLSRRQPLRGHVTGISRPDRDDVAWVLVNAEPEYDDGGEITLVVLSFVDITERKKAEAELRTLYAELEQRVSERTADLNEKTLELEQANAKLKELDRLKSLFIASMSHELRTPLNSIIGFSTVIHDEWIGPVNAEQKENLAIILRSGKHLLTLINDVIDVSKIEAGIIEPVPEQFDLRDLIEEAISLIKQELEEKGVDLRIDAAPQQMYTDRCRLLQCVLNLLSNAVKFTKHGGVTVETRVINGPCEMPEACSAEIAVTDTGVGIREEDLPRMFQPFVRLVTPGEVTVPGTGLGLYLSRKLAAEILKGDILLTSEYGKGSRFVLKVPVRLP